MANGDDWSWLTGGWDWPETAQSPDDWSWLSGGWDWPEAGGNPWDWPEPWDLPPEEEQEWIDMGVNIRGVVNTTGMNLTDKFVMDMQTGQLRSLTDLKNAAKAGDREAKGFLGQLWDMISTPKGLMGTALGLGGLAALLGGLFSGSPGRLKFPLQQRTQLQLTPEEEEFRDIQLQRARDLASISGATTPMILKALTEGQEDISGLFSGAMRTANTQMGTRESVANAARRALTTPTQELSRFRRFG